MSTLMFGNVYWNVFSFEVRFRQLTKEEKIAANKRCRVRSLDLRNTWIKIWYRRVTDLFIGDTARPVLVCDTKKRGVARGYWLVPRSRAELFELAMQPGITETKSDAYVRRFRMARLVLPEHCEVESALEIVTLCGPLAGTPAIYQVADNVIAFPRAQVEMEEAEQIS